MTQHDAPGSVPRRAPAGARDPVRVFESLQRGAVTELGGVLSGFWSAIEEQVRLAALAGHDYAAAQDDRVAVTALSHRALELATRYREAVEREFERWRHPRDAAAPAKSLSLMTEGELEVHLAGRQITELLDHQFLHPLSQLDERLHALALALDIQRPQQNPMRPEVAVAAFTELFSADDLTPGLRQLVFRQFDKRLPKVLGDVYARANESLEAFTAPTQAPAAPTVRYVAAPSAAGYTGASSRAGGQGWVPEGGIVEHLGGGGLPLDGALPLDGMLPGDVMPAGVSAPVAAQSAATWRARAQVLAGQAEGQPLRYRDLVRDQLHAWRERAARVAERPVATDVPAFAADGSQILGTEELLTVASLLQGDDPAPYTRALAGEDARPLAEVIRHEILGSLDQIGFDPAATSFSVDEEDAIDLVGILFQALMEANDLLKQSRDLYGRLVVPYLKVALTDDSLFNRRSHPARQLLDALTEACDGNAGETPQDREMLDRASQAVDRVVDEYQDDQAIFELATSELRDQLDQQRKRAELAERRAAEGIHGRERLSQARRDADGMVASRFADRAITAPVAQFLDRQWRHHLTQTWLRDGPDSQRHRDAIRLGDAILQVDVDAAQARGGAVADQLLALQLPLGDCYSSCGMDAGAARDSMARIISALAMPDTPRMVRVREGGDVDMVEPVEEEPVVSGLRLAGGTATLDFDPTIAARMRRLRVGQGVRLTDEDGHETAGRIAWISPLTSRFLIVNRRGARKLVVSPEELAALVAKGRAVVRSVDAPFDEAMKQLWQRLNQATADAQVS